mgnify:CR=1 FL=1
MNNLFKACSIYGFCRASTSDWRNSTSYKSLFESMWSKTQVSYYTEASIALQEKRRKISKTLSLSLYFSIYQLPKQAYTNHRS